jgi:large conductance mechanosensitive channel
VVLSFVIIAAVIYYLAVGPSIRFTAIANRKKEATERDCPECLQSIPVKATRCMFCTAQVPPVSQPTPAS